MGLVITLVGVGDKGFKTFELKLVGPCLVVFGGLLAVMRLLICTVRVTKDEAESMNEDEMVRVASFETDERRSILDRGGEEELVVKSDVGPAMEDAEQENRG